MHRDPRGLFSWCAHHPWTVAFVLSGVLALGVVCSVGIGAVTLAPGRVWLALVSPGSATPTDVTIVWDLRLPRTLLAAITGAALAASGAAFQGLFRNPLADPFVIGASSGAAFGATLAIMLGLGGSFLGLGPVPVAAFAGAIGAVALVYMLAGTGSATSVGTLLLAGSALGTVLSAVVSFLMISGEQPWIQVFSWLLGGFSGRSWPHLALVAPYVLIGVGGVWLLARPLDALTGGDDAARSLGLPLAGARLAIVATASLAAAASVAVSGIIGFVGLIAPHIARVVLGGSHGRLIPVSGLLGAILLVIADCVARSVLAPVEIPVGIITALLGGPFFLFVLRTRGLRLA